MKSIKGVVVLHRIRNGEHYQIHSIMSRFLETPIADFTELTEAYASYKQLFEHERLVFKHQNKMIGTEAIIEADRVRDNEFISVRMGIKSGLRSMDPEIRSAAELLMPVVNTYKQAPRKSYQEATGYISNLVLAFRNPANQPSVTKLGLGAAVDLLDEVNQAFETLYEQRTDWVGDQKLLGNMEMIRPQVDEAFEAVVYLINSAYAMNEVGAKDADKRAKLELIINKINKRLDNMIRTIAYRQPGGSTNPDPDPHPEPEPGPIVPYRFKASHVLLINGRILAVSPSNFEEFADLIDVRMVGGIMDFHPEGRSNRFTLDEISYDEETGLFPLSLRFIPTDDQDLLGTLSNEKYTVEVVKDDVVVLTIDEVNEPEGLA